MTDCACCTFLELTPESFAAAVRLRSTLVTDVFTKVLPFFFASRAGVPFAALSRFDFSISSSASSGSLTSETDYHRRHEDTSHLH